MKSAVTLHNLFPELEKKLPRVGVAQLPTPIEPLTQLGQAIGIKNLYVKRDDKSGTIYGGNKIRKLDFILPEAIRSGAKQVLTFGCDGSNHATATAVCAKLCNLSSINILFSQPNADYIIKNLMLSKWAGAKLCHVNTPDQLASKARWERFKSLLTTGRMPFVIPAGGSTPLGSMGFVNAAFELKMQIEQGLMPRPDFIFLPMGTTGTCSGLSVGLTASGLTDVTVVAVRIVDKQYVSEDVLWNHIHATAAKLTQLTGISDCLPDKKRMRVEDNFLGKAYSVYTPEGIQAINLMRQTQKINLDGTYSGKALAALIGTKNEMADKTVLFWNTYNSRDFSDKIKLMQRKSLPEKFAAYFTSPAQNA